MARIAVFFFTLTGNVGRLARAVAQGARDAGADVRLRQVEDFVPEEQLHAAARAARRDFADVPLANNDDLRWCDGAAFGSPTRYGNMAAQLKRFIDQTGQLWLKGALVGKVGAVFTSTSTQHGGQESTLLTMMIPLLHLGFLVMGLPYAEQRQMGLDHIHGGSPYGVSSVSGMVADRAPTEADLAMARSLGWRLSEAAEKLRR